MFKISKLSLKGMRKIFDVHKHDVYVFPAFFNSEQSVEKPSHFQHRGI